MTTEPADALVVNVAGLLGEPPGSHRDLAIEGVRIDLGSDLCQGRPLGLEAKVSRTNRGVLVQGAVRTSLLGSCSRCLSPLDTAIEASIYEEVLPSVELRSGLPVDASAEPEAPRLTDHHELDLEPLAREAVQLAAPIAPVCRPGCLGLCPDCGADLNVEAHGRHGDAFDPRLAALRDLHVDD